MAVREIHVAPCPPALSLDAFALALCDLSPAQRRSFMPPPTGNPIEGLVIALDGEKLVGAAWGQRQPGSTAILWPPQLTSGADEVVAARLACAVAAGLDAAGIRMIQVLLPDRESPLVPALRAAGFECLADLLYLSWEAAAIPGGRPQELAFEPYHASQRDRLVRLIERTYDATQDCAAMNGKRPMDEVIDGYRATGEFRPENWLFVRAAESDVGVLLLADHRAAQHWELMYMGVVPSARGRNLGRIIVGHAQRLTHNAGAARLVLAVDAENFPAIKMYNETGFTAWDKRTVFVRFAAEDSQDQEPA